VTEHYREAANGCERIAESMRRRADALDNRSNEKRLKANRMRSKADKLGKAANELREAAKGKEGEAKDWRAVSTLLPRLERRCVGCALGYVPEGSSYNEIHSCGQTVGPLKVVNG